MAVTHLHLHLHLHLLLHLYLHLRLLKCPTWLSFGPLSPNS
jgi:hypothetical protein